MELAKEYILGNRLRKFKKLLCKEYRDADQKKIEQPMSMEGFKTYYEYDPDVNSKVRDIKDMCEYAIDTNRPTCLKMIWKKFTWVDTKISLVKIFRSGMHAEFDDFLKSVLTPAFSMESLIKRLLFLFSINTSSPDIGGLKALFHYIPPDAREFYAIITIQNIIAPSLNHLQCLDTFFCEYVSDHSIFEKNLFKRIKFSIHRTELTTILEFINQTPQYKWVDSEGNRFYHYAAMNHQHTHIFEKIND